ASLPLCSSACACFLSCFVLHCDLHSFPTRRSSDLVAQIALADPAAVGAQVRTMVQRQQCGGLSVDAEDDVAAVASVGTVGAAERFELLAPDRGAPVPTVAGGEVNGDTIYELGGHNVLISDEG